MKQNASRIRVILVLCCGMLMWVAAAGEGTGEMVPQDKGFSEHFTYEPLDFRRQAAQYELPLDPGRVVDFNQTASRVMLGDDAREGLLANGFVVTELPFDRNSEQFDEAYLVLEQRDVPILVTSSSLLHAYHILFDHTLQTIEARNLYDSMWHLSTGLFRGCYRTYGEADGELKEAARRSAVFLAVGLSLLRPDPEGDYLEVGGDVRREVDEAGRTRMVREITLPDGSAGGSLDREFTSLDKDKYSFEVPGDLAAEVRSELDLISEHAGFAPSPVFKYQEDYSQYVPRGHYTVSQKLRNYFRAMMWFGRMSMLLKGSPDIPPGSTCTTCDALISTYDARIQTIGACLLASLMAEDRDISASWDEVYEVTSFFVGFSDDLGPYEYMEAMNRVLGGTGNLAGIDEGAHGRLKARLAEYRAPEIYGGTGRCAVKPPFTPEQADECLAATRGFRLMGQRYVPDSYVFSNLVAPYVGPFRGRNMPFTAFEIPGVGIARVFPRGLDLLAVMGSDRALDVLDDLGDAAYEDYGEAFRKMYDELDGLDDHYWNQNLYWNWLWVLKSLVGQYGKGYPAFMQTKAWQDRLLTMALASWAELRHDTILYAKQSYTMALTGIPAPPPELDRPKGFVEPVPEVYNRLLSLTRMMRLGLIDMGMIQANEVSASNMARLESMLERLVAISVKELSGEEPDREDMDFIGEFGTMLKDVLDGVARDSQKTTMVADVHTDTNSGMVLEEGCGYVELIVVAWKNESGIWLAAGPEMSYYEFKQPMASRLTDEAWRQILELQKPDPPQWTASYRR
jgi:hypothetical protein